MRTLLAALLCLSLCFCLGASPAPAAPEPVPPPAAVQTGPNIPHAILGEIDKESSKAAIQFIEESNEGKANAIILEINSPGGSVRAGFLLAKAIEHSESPVVCVVDGEADSMAFAILQSCQLRVMTKRSSLMWHQPSLSGNFSGQEDDWKQLGENAANALRAVNKALAQTIAARLGMPVKDLMSKTNHGREWWLDSDQALKVNAVDMVEPSVKTVEQHMIDAWNLLQQLTKEVEKAPAAP